MSARHTDTRERGIMQIRKHFANGYGVSAVDRDASPIAQASSGTVEVAVLHGDRLCYATPITGDVLPYQTPDDLDRIIAQVEALPESPYCQHHRAPWRVTSAARARRPQVH